MKTFRSLAAALFVFALGHVATAQESSEVASLRAKAGKGNGIAQYNLGLAYAQGRGVAADLVEAYVWLSLARENGARGRALDTVVASLDKASLELARQRIAERKTALGMIPAAPTAAKSPAPAVVAENQPATPSQTGPAGTETAEDPVIARLRKERDAYSTKVGEIAADLFTVRIERDRLAEQAAEVQRNTQAASAASLSLQEQVRTAEARAAELARTGEAMKAELARTKQELATLATAPKPVPDTTALDVKTRELSAALAELEAARQFGRQVEDTLNKVNDEKARIAASAAAELEAARLFGQQVESTLNKVNDQKAALETQLATLGSEANRAKQEIAALTQAKEAVQQALAAKPAAPGYPDLSGRVSALETALAAAQKSAPAYPDLRGRVAELETQFALAQTAAKARTEELARANTKLAGDETAFAKINRELADTKSELVQAKQVLAAKPAAPSYPDLSGRVAELEAALTAARNAAPVYPDLSGRVSELEGQLASLQSAATAAAQLKSQLAEREAQVLQLAQEVKRGEIGLHQAQESYAALQTEANQLRLQPTAPGYPDLSGRVHELETALAGASRQLVALSAEATRAKQDVVALTKAKEELQNARPGTPAYPDLSDRVRELEAAVATSIHKFGAAEQGRVELSRQFDDYKSATAAAQRERTTLQATLKMLESDKASLRRQVDAATTESNQLRTQVAALKTQAATSRPAAPAYPDLSGRVGELESQLAKANTDLSAVGSAKADLSGKVAELEAALAAKPAAPSYPDLSGRVSELETALAATRNATPAYPDLSGKVAELTSAIQGAQTQIGGLTAEREAARTAQNELRDTVAKLTREKAEHIAARPTVPNYPDLSGRVSELETALAAARNTAPAYPNLTGKVAELEAALAAKPAAPAYPDLSGRVTEPEAALVAARNAAPAYPDLSGRVSDLTAEVTQLRTDRERMQKLLADSGRQLAEATAASRSRPVAPPGYIDRVRELEAALAQAKAAASPATPAYPDLSSRVSDLAGEIAQLRADRERMQKMLADAGRQLRDNTADTARIKELETQLAAKPGVPGYPDLSGRVSELESALATARNAAPAYPDLANRVSELESQLARANAALSAVGPAKADLSGRVRELEAQIAAVARGQAAPVYPDLSGRVSELEAALAAAKQQLAQAQPAPGPAATSTGDTSGLDQKLADMEDRLATALRGYAALQREHDTLAENAGKSAAAVTAERDALAGQVASLTGQIEQLRASARSSEGSNQAELVRLTEAVATLQRTSTQASRDAAAARALAQQLQGANSVLAGENYQLKTMLARTTGSSAAAPAPVTAPAARVHVVAAGDSLSRLSQRYYGSAGRWQEIYNANSTLLGPNGVLRVGTELRIP